MAGAFFFAFYWCFFEGVLENVRFWCGVFVVEAWWIYGELWLVDDPSVVVPNLPVFLNIPVDFQKRTGTAEAVPVSGWVVV